jgi:uncharacterized membrane protein
MEPHRVGRAAPRFAGALTYRSLSVSGTAESGHEGNIESSHGAARTHVLLSLAAGVVAAGVSTPFTTWQIAVLIGWDMVLYHAYMSYIFGTVVVAMTINVVASLLNR